jgi:hypothetical protein
LGFASLTEMAIVSPCSAFLIHARDPTSAMWTAMLAP